MASNRLVILGAGSSASYGFPTGEDLKKLILCPDIATSNNALLLSKYLNAESIDTYFRYLRALTISNGSGKHLVFKTSSGNSSSISYRKLNDFRNAFTKSSVISIDAFISQVENPDYELIAKMLIVLVIRAFSSEKIFQNNVNDDWIAYYINKNIDWKESFEEDFPSVISFNYDNLYEVKIINHLKHIGKNTSEDFKKDVISPTHIYGSISSNDYGVLKSDDTEHMRYLLMEYISRNINEINFIRNENGESDFVKSIQDKVNEAQEIYVLGDGFDRLNNKILFKDEGTFRNLLRSQKVKGVTGYGIPDYVNLFFHNSNAGSSFLSDAKCRELLVAKMGASLFP